MTIIVKAFAVWLLMASAAIVNGLVRDSLLAAWMGGAAALPVSGVLLALLVFGIAYLCLPLFGRLRAMAYVGIGLFWVGVTLAFEFAMEHYALGKPWSEVFRVFDFRRGNLFSLVLVVTFGAPWLAARLRNSRLRG